MVEIVRAGLIQQTLLSLAMLRQCVERAPDDVYFGGTHPRSFWRIAYHAAAYAHLYLYPNMDAWKKWPKHRVEATYLDGEVEEIEPYSRAEMLEFIGLIQSEVASQIGEMDLEEMDCGYPWYPGLPRFNHQVLSLRHLHGHIGQLAEILISHDIDTDWMGMEESS